MSLTPSPLWKRWRRTLRKRVKKSPSLRRDYKRSRSLRVRHEPWTRLRGFVPLILATIIWANPDIPLEPIASWLLLWTFLILFARAQQAAAVFKDPNVLWLWYGWPVTDDAVFAHHRTQVLRASLWIGIDWLAFAGAAAMRLESVSLALAAPLFAAAQSAATLAMALWLVRWRPRLPFGWAVSLFSLLAFFGFQLGDETNELSRYLGHVVDTLRLTPPGWLLHAFELITSGQRSGWILLVGLLAGSLVLARGAFSALRRQFDLNTLFGYEPESRNDAGYSELPEGERALTDVDDNFSEGQHLETAPVDMDVLRTKIARTFETPAGHVFRERGQAERAAGWFLNERQRALLDFMLPGGKPWARRWMIAVTLGALALLLGNLAHPLLIGGLSIAALGFALPLFGGSWAGFESLRIFTTQVGLVALIPARFGEISRLILKINALHCLFALPLVMAILWAGFAPPAASPWWALDYGIRLTGFVLALQPVWLMGKFSSNTNDSSAGKIFLFGLVVVLITAVVAGVSLSAVLFMAEPTRIGLGCAVGLNLLSHGVLALYGLAWNRGWFDLIAKAK